MANAGELNFKISADVNNAVSGLNKVQQGLATTAVAAAKVDSSLQKTSAVTGAASQTFVNLGRVLQDAPYGFIGIANNLNPLVEGFQRLSAQAKTAGVSIGSTLLSALKGPAGIGLALSAVTAAVQFAVIGLQAWGITAKDTSGELDQAAESAKKLKTSIDGINSAAASELTKVKELVSGFEQENVSRREKIGIIKQLKEINPEYFGQLSAEKTTIGELRVAYDNYNNSIQSSIKTKVLSKQLEDLVEKELKLRDAMDFTNKLITLRQGFKLKDQGGTDPQVEKQQAALNSQQQELNRNLSQQAGLLSKINALGGVDSIFKFSQPQAEKAKKDVEEITGLYRNLAIQLAATTVPDFSKPIQRVLDKGPDLKVDMKIPVDPQIKIDEDALKKRAEGIAGIVSESLSSAFESIGQSVGGTGNVFAGIFKVIGEGLQQLGKYLIVTSKLIATVKDTLNKVLLVPGGQFLGIGLGVSLIALGALLEKNLPKLAAGGIVTRPTNALIGESGPEAVIPLGRMQGLLSNNDGGGRVVFEIAGRKLVGVLQRENASILRNG